MRILYGITGEGLGHTMRARVVLPHLVRRGHVVKVAASGRAARLFAELGFSVLPIRGLGIAYRDGAAQRVETVIANARRALPALRANVGRGFAQVVAFDPDVAISDFDSFSYGAARVLGRPVISLDHHHVLTRFHHPRPVTSRLSYDFGLTHTLVKRKLPHCERYLVSSFFFPEARAASAASTVLFGPMVREAIATATPTRGEHVLVYQTAAGDPRLEAALADVPELRFEVYGLGAKPATRNVRFHPFDEARFVSHLASARAVIANGGFMTLSEAAVLGKPVLSCPIRHQGEQELNAAWLEHLGLGLGRRRILPKDIRAIVDHVPRAPIAPATTEALAAIDRALREVTGPGLEQESA